MYMNIYIYIHITVCTYSQSNPHTLNICTPHAEPIQKQNQKQIQKQGKIAYPSHTSKESRDIVIFFTFFHLFVSC